MGLGIFSPSAWEARAVVKAIEQLHREQSPVRIEIERLGVRFKTFITLRKDMVAISRPMGFKPDLPVGSVLRLRVPGRLGKELRFEVLNPDFRLPNGRGFFICPMPKGFAQKSPRATERYSTGRFTNLELAFPGLGTAYRMLDLSMTGCRIDSGQEQLGQIWTLGEPVQPAIIQVGAGIRIPLEAVVPRLIKAGMIGLEFVLPPDGKSAAHLDKLVKWLDKREDKLSRVIKN